MLVLLPSLVVATDDVTVSATVSKSFAVTFPYLAVAFGSVTQGTNDNQPSPVNSAGQYNATIDTNYDWKVSVNGTDLDDGGGHTFGVGNLTVDTNAVAGNLNPTQVVTSVKTQVDTYTTIGDGILNYQGYLVDVPSYQYASAYTSTVTWTYENQ